MSATMVDLSRPFSAVFESVEVLRSRGVASTGGASPALIDVSFVKKSSQPPSSAVVSAVQCERASERAQAAHMQQHNGKQTNMYVR